MRIERDGEMSKARALAIPIENILGKTRRLKWKDWQWRESRKYKKGSISWVRR